MGSGRRRTLVVLFVALLAGGALAEAVGAQAQGPDFKVPPHLSWQHDPTTSVTVTWATSAEAPTSGVRYGATPALEQGLIRAQTYPFLQGFSGFGHMAELTGLGPGRRYYYSAGSNGTGWSAVTPFDTGPAGSVAFQFNAVADMGTSAAAASTVKAMTLGGYNFTLHAGDISYAGGDQGKWNQFMAMIQPVSSGQAYMTVPGNHENETRLQLGSYLARFVMQPDANPQDAGRSGLYYSFNYSNVHVIGLEADNHGGIYPNALGWDPAQTAWLGHDLAATVNDTAHPWTIVFFHFPPFSSSTDHGSWKAARHAWSPLFDRYRVALVITGHDHDYERTYPVDASERVVNTSPNGTLVHPGAPVYVVTGGGGESHAQFNSAPPWSAKRASVFEFLRVQVNGGVLSVAAINTEDGGLVDCFQIVRGPTVANMSSPCSPLTPLERVGRMVEANFPWVIVGGAAAGATAGAAARRALRRHRSEH